jgi:hypothetical protein
MKSALKVLVIPTTGEYERLRYTQKQVIGVPWINRRLQRRTKVGSVRLTGRDHGA